MKENLQITDCFSWGIIGSPNGFQKSVQGVDTQFSDGVQHRDLNGDGAIAFPSPNRNAITEPLYCLYSFYKDDKQVTTLAQYCSVKQQGSHRLGTYAGAFIEAINVNLNQRQNSILFDILWDLTKFNLKNFVDMEKLTYKENILNVNFPTPQKVSQLELNDVNPFIIPQPESEVIFVSFQNEKERNDLISILIENNFIHYYQKIYFSDNAEMIENFKTKTNVKCFTVRELSKLSEVISYFYSGIFELNNLYGKSQQENEQLRAEFKTELNNKITDIQNEADKQRDEFEENLKNITRSKILEYQSTIKAQEKVLSEVNTKNTELSTELKRYEGIKKVSIQIEQLLKEVNADDEVKTSFISERDISKLNEILTNFNQDLRLISGKLSEINVIRQEIKNIKTTKPQEIESDILKKNPLYQNEQPQKSRIVIKCMKKLCEPLWMGILFFLIIGFVGFIFRENVENIMNSLTNVTK